MTQEELFQKYFPPLGDKEVLDSVQAEGVVVSMVGRRGTPDLFIVKFSTERRQYPPIVMNQKTAQMLHLILQQQGF